MAKGHSSNKGNDKKDGHLRKERRTEWIKIKVNILDFPSSNKSFKSYLFAEAKIIASVLVLNVCR